eukprot:gene18119-24555_t
MDSPTSDTHMAVLDPPQVPTVCFTTADGSDEGHDCSWGGAGEAEMKALKDQMAEIDKKTADMVEEKVRGGVPKAIEEQLAVSPN